jgi:hypothetical protein
MLRCGRVMCCIIGGEDVRHGWDMIHIRIVNHCGHRLFDVSFAEFVLCVLFPYGFEVEPGPVKQFLQESETSRVCDPGASLVVILIGGQDPVCIFLCIVVLVGFDDTFKLSADLRVRCE